MKKAFFHIIFLLFLITHVSASHIVGGEIYYDQLNSSSYRITVKVYRDCINGQSPFAGINDGSGPFVPAMLTVYTADSTLVNTYDIGAPVITLIPPSINNPCIKPPIGICVEEGVYTYTLNLPPKTGGYFVIYQVVFRNATIMNLAAPNAQGATYYTFIPGPETAVTNNSPRYNGFPPIYICNNVNFTFDHKATDPDGDQLVYSLCAPYDGQNGSPAPPPPYPNVNYVTPFSGSYPIAASPAFSIHPTTGMLTGKPNTLGQYVVGICVQEYRGNTLINTHFRDFQFNVVPCIVNVVSGVAEQTSHCIGNTITFTNSSTSNIGTLTYFWDFGVQGTQSDTSHAVNPTYTYQDTGKYLVTLIANPNKPCSDTLKKIVHVYPELNISFPPVSKQCLKGNSFSFSVQGAYLPQATFTWSFGSAANPATSNLSNPVNVNFTQAGKYLVKLTGKQLTCIDSFIDSVRIVPRPVAKINNLPVTLCDPATVAFSNGSSSELPVSYQWYFSNGSSSNSFQPVQKFSPPGVYSATLVVTTTSLCIDTSIASVNNITVTPTPKAGFSFSPQVTTIFDPQITFVNKASPDVSYWQYSFGDGTYSNYADNLHYYQDYGDYNVTQIVTNPYYCTDTITHTLKILPEYRFWVPNTFTPDENSLNDVFIPVAVGVTDYELNVFTRWGETIFNTQDPKEGWNGSYKGKECEQDVYAWRVKFKNVVTLKNEIHYGHVLLLKNR